ncbi:hypothetical protein TL16_g12970 [Triparma laevis f. inornata]|uniref:Uncharacterized protein n=1 Tax=Triparma laevis f. inornata TaxID=1714386 RepID=A0A9W7BYE1_9STRA|nr:hypothetical protein TL16_g12970 [Triparma laevis f. inornata]
MNSPLILKLSISYDYKLTSIGEAFYTQSGLINLSGSREVGVWIKRIIGFENFVRNFNHLIRKTTEGIEEEEDYECTVDTVPKSIVKFSGGADYNFVRVLKKISYKDGNLKVSVQISTNPKYDIKWENVTIGLKVNKFEGVIKTENKYRILENDGGLVQLKTEDISSGERRIVKCIFGGVQRQDDVGVFLRMYGEGGLGGMIEIKCEGAEVIEDRRIRVSVKA